MKMWLSTLALCLCALPLQAQEAPADLPTAPTETAPKLHAVPREFSVDMGASILVPTDATAAPLGPNRNMGSFLLRIGVEVRRNLFIDAQWTSGEQITRLFGDEGLHHKLGVHWLSLGARWTRPVASWLRPFARAGGGVVREAIQVYSDNVSYSGTFWAPQLYGTVGLDLLLPPRLFSRRPGAKFTMGMSYEFGYTHAFAQDVVLQGGRSLSPSLPRPGLDLGSLALGGWLHQIAFTVRF